MTWSGSGSIVNKFLSLRRYLLRGIGFERTGVLGIVGAWATFWKKLDPAALFGTTLTLFTGAGLGFSLAAVSLEDAFVTVDVVFVGAVVAVVFAGGAEVATGLSTFVLEVSLELI